MGNFFFLEKLISNSSEKSFFYGEKEEKIWLLLTWIVNFLYLFFDKNLLALLICYMGYIQEFNEFRRQSIN